MAVVAQGITKIDKTDTNYRLTNAQGKSILSFVFPFGGGWHMNKQAKRGADRTSTDSDSAATRQARQKCASLLKGLDRSTQQRSRPPDRCDPRFHDIYMPAMPPLKLIAAIRTRFLAWRNRRCMRQLLTYDDHILADIGFRRKDLCWALQLPLTTDAAEALRQRRFVDQLDRSPFVDT